MPIWIQFQRGVVLGVRVREIDRCAWETNELAKRTAASLVFVVVLVVCIFVYVCFSVVWNRRIAVDVAILWPFGNAKPMSMPNANPMPMPIHGNAAVHGLVFLCMDPDWYRNF